MRAIIDNSTVTAALRSMGHVPTEDRRLFEIDTAALRVLVDAVVYADEVVIPDTYQEEHTKSRKEILADPVFRFQVVPQGLDDKLLKNARAHVRNWHMTEKLGTELSRAFEDLAIMFKHAWRRSESFLVMKAFGVDNVYHSSIVSAFDEFIHSARESGVNLSEFDAKSYNNETTRFVQSLSWMAIRTVYYRQMAKVTGCEYLSHPLRNLFNLKCILFDNHPHTRKTKLHSAALEAQVGRTPEEHRMLLLAALERDRYFESVDRFCQTFWQECNTADSNVFGVATYDAELPPTLAYVIHKAHGEGSSVLRAALALRAERSVVALRQRLQRVYGARSENERAAELREWISELRGLKQRLQIYLGYERERVQVAAKLVSYDLTVPRCMTKPFYPFRPHLAFIRDVIVELASVGSMGAQLDRLWLMRQNTQERRAKV